MSDIGSTYNSSQNNRENPFLGGTARKAIDLLPIGTTNLLFSCYKRFSRYCPLSNPITNLATPVRAIKTIQIRLKSPENNAPPVSGCLELDTTSFIINAYIQSPPM